MGHRGRVRRVGRRLARRGFRLGYPRAALFAFAVALAAYNVLAVIKASIRATHGTAVEPGVYGYHVANEVAAASRGLLIAIPAAEWAAFARV